MRTSATRHVITPLSWLVVVGWLASAPVLAHNQDTSYARLRIERDALTANLVYDVTSLALVDATLDADRDGSLAPAELQAAVPRIEDFLRRSIRLEIDGRPAAFGPLDPVAWPPEAGATIPERDYHAVTSLVAFTFRTPFPHPPADVWIRFDVFDVLGGRHAVLGVIAADDREVPLPFTEGEPDYLFETSFVEAAPAGARQSGVEGRRSGGEASWTRARRFFVLGVEHILTGYDHILFLLALIVLGSPRELVGLVTAFTLAHSITLALATLGWVALPATLVETAIAGTIVFTALENLWISDTRRRWQTTFAFGLIHGFGFAGVLRDLGLPTEGFFRSLLAFNVGVEAGQMAIVGLLVWPAAALARGRHGATAQWLVSLGVAACGLGWLIDRACGLELMPF